MDPSQLDREGDSSILKVLTPAQLALIVDAIYAVRKSGGYGKVSIEFRAGSVKFIVTETRQEP